MPVSFEKRDRIGIVTLSRPEARNAWGNDFTDGIATYFSEMEDDDEIRAAILTGDDEGGAFSAGANLKNPNTHTLNSVTDFVKGLPKQRLRQFEVLSNFPKPLIGAINGYAIGVGCIITFCCDLLVASEKAEWRLPQSSLGVMPAYGGSPRLARWVGRGNAMKMAMGYPLKADEAYRIGLAQWLVPHEQLMETALDVAGHIASLPPLAIQLTKESLLRGLDIPSIEAASHVDLYRFMTLSMTEDKTEGHAAWRERRPRPEFYGR